MLNRILRSYTVTQASLRILVPLRQYMESLETHRGIVLDKLLAAKGLRSPGIELLRHVLFLVDHRVLDTAETYADLVDMVLSASEVYYDLLDGETNGRTLRGLFTLDRSCNDHIVPMGYTSAVRDLPTTWEWDEWDAIRPLRLLDTDSRELTYRLDEGRVRYKLDTPSVSVYGVDPITLVLKYMAWRRVNPNRDEWTEHDYLYREVFAKGISLDITSVWLRNRYTDVVAQTVAESTDLSYTNYAYVHHNSYGYIPSQYTAGMKSVRRMIADVKKGTVTPDVALQSLLTLTGPLFKEYVELQDVAGVANLRQYAWAEALRDLPWLELAATMYSLRPQTPRYASLSTQLRLDIRSLERHVSSNWGGRISDPLVELLNTRLSKVVSLMSL